MLGDGLVTAGELDSGGESIADEDVDGIAAILEFALRVGEGGPRDGLLDGDIAGFCGTIWPLARRWAKPLRMLRPDIVLPCTCSSNFIG